MTRGNYMIYKMHRDEEDVVTLFFLPDDSLRRVTERLMKLKSMRDSGYKPMGVAYVDKETYLNLRLNETVKDCCEMDTQEQDLRAKYRLGLVDFDVAMQTLEMMRDYKWTCMKKLSMQVRRLIREDFTIYNETAIQLFNMYQRELL